MHEGLRIARATGADWPVIEGWNLGPSDGPCFLAQEPAYRGQGYGYATWRAALPHAGSRPVGFDGVVA